MMVGSDAHTFSRRILKSVELFGLIVMKSCEKVVKFVAVI